MKLSYGRSLELNIELNKVKLSIFIISDLTVYGVLLYAVKNL